ncbi:MAG: class I SAM-dependent methyltransferase [Oscillospiraceae bacterium]
MFDWFAKKQDWLDSMGIALRGNPAVRWYIEALCPELVPVIQAITKREQDIYSVEEIRTAEVTVLSHVEDFTAYTRPECMETACDFIYGWDKVRLFEMAELAGKIVLDVGSGNGRLAFAAAERAREVYAVEPVGTLRRFMQDKAQRTGVRNLRVTDGYADRIPYPDNTFDIVMSGHVVGDDYDRELAELTRVCKNGGWLLDCPGDQHHNLYPCDALIKRGWESMYYIGSFGADVYRYRIQVKK